MHRDTSTRFATQSLSSFLHGRLRRFLPAIVPFLFFAATATGQESSPPYRRHASLGEAGEFGIFLDSLIIPRMAELHIPGLVIAVVKDGRLFFFKGYGYADVGKRLPVDPIRTEFRIASISKLFTATAVLQMAEQKKLDLDADINTYLADVRVPPAFDRPITLRHLLTHTAGFDDEYIGKSARTEAEQRPLGRFLAEEMPARLLPPGEVYSYSNYGNALAAYAVECLSGRDYAACAADSIFAPLGMTRTSYRLPANLAPDLAVCYANDGGGIRDVPFDFINDYPGGQAISTADDMARFMIAYLEGGIFGNHRIVRDSTARAMMRTQFTHHAGLRSTVGFGFHQFPFRGATVVGHDGAYLGSSTRLWLLPEYGIGIFIAANLMVPTLNDEITFRIIGDYLPPPSRERRIGPLPDMPPHDTNVAAFAGTYRFTRYSHRSFAKAGSLFGMTGNEMQIGTTADGMITMGTLRNTERRMIQVEPGFFRSIDDEYSCAFRMANGKPTHLFTNGTTAFERIASYERAGLHRVFMPMALVVFAALGAGSLVGRLRHHVSPVPLLHRWAVWSAGACIVHFIGLGVVLLAVIPRSELMIGFGYGVPWELYLVQAVPCVAIFFFAGFIFEYVRALVTRRLSLRLSLSYLTFSCLTILYLCCLNYWNLIGFRF